MSNSGLTPVSYLVLGLVANGAATPYDLKRKVALSVGNMWSFPHSALYAEPARLTRLGLLTEEREQSGRRRRTYSITDQGRAALVAWLRTPTQEPPQLRDLGLLKLFFGDLVDESDIAALARQQERTHRERLAAYEELAGSELHGQIGRYPAETLRMGLAVERAFVDFWSSIGAEVEVTGG